MMVSAVGALWWTASLVAFAASLIGAVVQPLIRRRQATSATLPPVSLIVPVKLVNPGFLRAQQSIFHQDYPLYEVLVGAAETGSPALDVMRGLAAGGGVPTRVLHSPTTAAVSPKLNVLTAPLLAAAHDVVMTKDSNISLAPTTLHDMMRSLGPGVGLVCAVPVAVRPETLAGVIEAILINRDARLLLTASACGKGFGIGKVMLFRRSALEKAGGIAAMSYTIAEDSALAKGFAEIGLRTVFSDRTVDQEIGARSLRDVYARQARWAAIRRAEEPVSFPLEPLACPIPAALAGALAAPLLGLSGMAGFGLTLGGWFAIELIVTAIKRWDISPWHPIAFLGRDLVLLGAWAAAWTTREVTWAGSKQDVRDVLRKPRG